MLKHAFHPAVQAWFEQTFASPTEVQKQAWAAISGGRHTLLAAPTGSGKTLAAFLSAINELIIQGLQQPLPDATRILYISPLKALSNDIQVNLQQPLQGIREQLQIMELPEVDIRAWVRTGDTPQSERQKAKRLPPHILITTPESFYILLTSASGRQMLGTVETVIVDEIHALAGNKRGAHLSLSLERLQALRNKPLKRLGLSATQKPITAMAQFLLGQREDPCEIIDTGHLRERDLSMVVPGAPLEAVMSNAVWEEIYDRLQVLITSHQSTLVFVNTRRLAERAARFLAERLGEQHVMSHHGSMAKEQRLAAEQRLKNGALKCLVATASLELGIDIGQVDLVCQLGSPRSIAVFLQRVGRSGHAIGATPKGRLFPLSRDELVETTALLHAARNGDLDCVMIPEQPLDILAQQIVAEVADGEWQCDELYHAFKRAWPYRNLQMQDFEQLVQMLAQGFSTRRGRRSAHIHFDAVNRRLRPRQGTRLTALTNGGAIPDQFDYEVILSPEGFRVGTLNEDFAFESLPGDIFQLGNTSYRILKIEQGKVHVADAHGEPPNIPFWFGEAPGRSDELSFAVSQLRTNVEQHLHEGLTPTVRWLVETYTIPQSAAEQLANYLAATQAALGVIPTQERIVMERFLDEVGDMHLVIHSPYGSRINRAWGLALRKRFCRQFNFELQAAALEDTIILSLSATHSFPLDEVRSYLHPATVRTVLIQALLAVPLFATRWRWNATIALAVKRFSHGKRTPPFFQRADAEDLVAVIFPEQLACQENIAGEREIPDHPLVTQTINDCLHDAMDCNGLEALLQRLLQGEIELLCKDLSGPSPMAQEIINARPYAFLDDAPAEERRTLAIRARNYADPADAAELAGLDPEAISRVRQEAWPLARNVDELHEALILLGFVNESAGELQANPGWRECMSSLQQDGRACLFMTHGGAKLWVVAERLSEMQLIFPDAKLDPVIKAPINTTEPTNRDAALREIIRSRLECLGPVTALQLARSLNIAENKVKAILLALEQEGFVVRGRFSQIETDDEEWCDRHLLARIHRYTIKQLRNEIEAVTSAVFIRFLFNWQGLTDKSDGPEALAAVLRQLEGFPVAAAAWEADVIPARIKHYSSDMLDTLCASGRLTWLRLLVTAHGEGKKLPPLPNAPINLIERQHLGLWRKLSPLQENSQQHLSANAEKILALLRGQGASFFSDLVEQTGLLKTYSESALGELVNWGLVTSDNYSGLRTLIKPQSRRPRSVTRRGRYNMGSPFDNAGRWSLLTAPESSNVDEQDIEFLAWRFLQRYGVVFRTLLTRESIVPPWRDLLHAYWRMEARGEIRGGRFVSGMAGEQFALPDAVATLRRMRREKAGGKLQVISATDPLNLAGILLPGDKIAATLNNRIVCRDGIPIMLQTGNEIRSLTMLDNETSRQGTLLLTLQHRGAGFKKKPVVARFPMV